ncbi:HEPN domain-containing protein [Caballeronia hypogeia]|nr:HEPN domain-containing protein [Caballeronia hypogeia]
MQEILPRHTLDHYPALNTDEARRIVREFIALPDDVRGVMRVALKRINQAHLRHDVGDKAVELATAFEALLGDGGTNEMTHKITVRSVRLLGGTLSEREINKVIVNKMYSVRSKLVHTGKVDETKKVNVRGEQLTSQEIVDQALLLGVRVATKIIFDKKIPDWEAFDIREHCAVIPEIE